MLSLANKQIKDDTCLNHKANITIVKITKISVKWIKVVKIAAANRRLNKKYVHDSTFIAPLLTIYSLLVLA